MSAESRAHETHSHKDRDTERKRVNHNLMQRSFGAALRAVNCHCFIKLCSVQNFYYSLLVSCVAFVNPILMRCNRRETHVRKIEYKEKQQRFNLCLTVFCTYFHFCCGFAVPPSKFLASKWKKNRTRKYSIAWTIPCHVQCAIGSRNQNRKKLHFMPFADIRCSTCIARKGTNNNNNRQ